MPSNVSRPSVFLGCASNETPTAQIPVGQKRDRCHAHIGETYIAVPKSSSKKDLSAGVPSVCATQSQLSRESAIVIDRKAESYSPILTTKIVRRQAVERLEGCVCSFGFGIFAPCRLSMKRHLPVDDDANGDKATHSVLSGSLLSQHSTV